MPRTFIFAGKAAPGYAAAKQIIALIHAVARVIEADRHARGLIRVVFVPRLWARAVALVSGMWGVATLCGPAVGGLFAQGGDWRWAFWTLLPVSAAQAALVAVQLRGGHAKEGAPGIAARQITLLAASVLAVSRAAG